MKNMTSLIKALFSIAFITTINYGYGQNPGSVGSNLQLWMKANAGTSSTTNNAAVNSWQDQSSNSFTATKGSSNAPIYRTNVINFNPAIQFNTSRSQKRYFKIPNATVNGTGLDITPSPAAGITNPSDMSIFAAFLTDGSGAGTMFSRATSSSRSYQLWLGDRDRVVHYTLARTSGTSQSDPNSGINFGIVHARNDAKISSITIDINTTMANDPNTNKILRYVNGFLDPLTTHTDGDAGFGTGETTNMDVLIGARRNSSNTNTGNELIGNVAELIVYNRKLSAFERQKVETYLAIKYGITLGYNDEYYEWQNSPNTTTTFGYGGTSNDYILSNGSVAWKGSENMGYGYNVFGIGRDDGSALLQLKSKSVHVEEITKNTSVITMTDESNSIPNDRSYLLVGNNGLAVQLQSSSVPERVTQTINRVWKARESTNNVGSVKLEFDLSQFSISGAQDLELIISDNNNLTNYKNIKGSYNSSAKIMTFTGLDLQDGEYFTLAKLQELESSYHFDFNGTNKYVDLGDNFDLTGNFTISAWIKRESATNRSIVSKMKSNQGYNFRIDANNKLEMYWYSAGSFYQSVISNTVIPTGKWHHVAAIYNNNQLTLYIDGVKERTRTRQNPVATGHSALIGALDGSSPGSFFRGDIDELRIWNVALTENQLHYIMNQEIEEKSGFVTGSYFESRGLNPTKNEVEVIPWSRLIAYFPFSRVRGNCLFNKSSNTTANGRMYNTSTASIETQTAPLPYVSRANGSWNNSNTWENGDVQDVPGHRSIKSSSLQVDWNIVAIGHDITMDNSDLPSVDDHQNRKLLALFVDANELTVSGVNGSSGNGLTVSHCLTLDGRIDLNGESQLIQDEDSDLVVGANGRLERDQQGTRDLYTYNYWSSPVGVTSMGSNIVSFRYKLPNVFRGGTNPSSPTSINFVTGYDGSVSGSNISIASYWIWKFANQPDDDYSAWQQIGNTGDLLPGEGFTMKGVANTNGNVSLEQNYIYQGKPNNGDIELTLNANNDYLVGNPYPSAIDARQFILDNGPNIEGPGNTTGTLYFWEHWGGGSHYLAEYQGGYATYNLAGGVPAASYGTIDPDVDQTGTLIGTKLPGRYIPVGQGFFVVGENTGNINFNNGQRVFRKEGGSDSVFMRNGNNAVSNPSTEASTEDGDGRLKIRLGFNSVNTIHRQILLTVDESATVGYDWGFDGHLNEEQMDDMYWIIEDDKFVIQGIDDINIYDTYLPLSIKTNMEGENTIAIEALENVPDDLEIYLHDLQLQFFHDLRASEYKIDLPAGEHNERFEVVFHIPGSLSIDDQEIDNLNFYYAMNRNKVVVLNPKNVELKNIEVYNITGQSVYSTNRVMEGRYNEYELQNLSTGTYIIKLNTADDKALTKKIIVK